LTAPRRQLVQLLERQPAPRSVAELFELLPGGSCNLTTVYRSIQMLVRVGLVKRFQIGDGVARYALLPEGHSAHRHHVFCTKCSRIVEIGGCFPPEFEHRVAVQTAFKSVTHRLEFFGLCPACQ
jgi:Fur family ferric uptake transcriptional regulator